MSWLIGFNAEVCWHVPLMSSLANSYLVPFKKLDQELTMSLPDSEDTEEDDEECCWRLDRDTGEPALSGDEESLCCFSLEVFKSKTFWTKMTRNIVKINLAFVLKAKKKKKVISTKKLCDSNYLLLMSIILALCLFPHCWMIHSL